MPRCFTLTKKGDTEPMILQDVDDFICKELNVLPDPVRYYSGWYDCIGLAIAAGYELGSDKLRELFGDDIRLSNVLRILEQHFISDAWWEGK